MEAQAGVGVQSEVTDGPGPDAAVLHRPARLAAVALARRVLAASGVPLDRLARLTARAAHAPLAAISLLDADLEYFIAVHGTNRAETPRSVSLCQYVVSADAPLIIADTADTSAGDMPPVSREVHAAGLVAYAGFPLHLGGAPIGAFCVADLRPREWSADELAAVGDAAGVVTALLAGDLAAQDVATEAAESGTVVDAMREAFLAVSPDGVILRWSAGAEELLGWTAAEALGHTADRLIVAPRSRPDFETAVARAGPQARTPLLWVRNRAGHEFPVDTSVSTAEVAAGRRVYLFLHDASGRVAAERETALHRGFLEALLESLDVGVTACDVRGGHVLANRALREMYGLPYTSLADRWPEHLDTYHPDGRPMTADELPLFRALAGEPIRDEPTMLRRPGERDRHFRVNGSQLRAGDELLGAVVAVHEVTGLVLTNRFKDCELAVSRVLERDAPLAETARDLLDTIVAALQWPYAELWLVDGESTALRLTAGCWAPGREVPGFGPDRLLPGQGLAGDAWQRGGPVWVPDLRGGQTMISADAVARSGLRAAVAIPVRSGEQILGVLALFAGTVEEPSDALEALITGVAAHIGQFLERSRAAELTAELARAKDTYVGLVGHELRTPLTSISAYTDLLIEDPALDGEQRQMLEVVQRNAATLRGIIADLLDLAALDAGHAEVRPRPTNLADVVRDALEAAAGDLSKQRLAVVSDIASAVVVSADTTRLRQVLDNLLSNAVRYTPPGGRVTVRLKRDGDLAVFSVTDTGPGIPALERAKLFSRFFRGSAAKAGCIPGSGLGLAISRAIVDKHGGSIAVLDRDGPGSTFVVRLPVLSGSP